MKQSKDPFEAAFEEQDESPPDSPAETNDIETQSPSASAALNQKESKDNGGKALISHQGTASTSTAPTGSARNKNKEDDEEEEEENMDMELKAPSSSDPDKMAIMQAILSQFTEGQMSRYESFRRSNFRGQRATMKRLLANIIGSQKISVPMTIAVSAIAKMFVGELVETAKGVMTERNESGPIRPCHIREAYRRLKLEGQVPRRSVSRLFR